MKSLNDLLEPVKTALLTVSENVGLFEAIDGTKDHIIYAPDGEGESLDLDNIKDSQVLQGTIDLFVVPENRSLADDIQAALNAAEISYSINSIQYEDLEKSKFIHYEWVFEVC